MLDVCAALHRELLRIGDRPTLRVDGRFSWRNILPIPAEPGAQTQREFTGRTAAVIDAAARVEHTYDILHGPLYALSEKLKRARAALKELDDFAGEHCTELVAAMHNANVTRQQGIAFGAEPRSVSPLDCDSMLAALENAHQTAEAFDPLIAGLEARMPDEITAGFYGPRGTGAVGHFAMLLREERCNLKAGEAAEIIGRVADREGFQYEQSRRNQRSAAVGSTKQLANRAKSKLSRTFGSGTARASRDVPTGELKVLLLQVNAGANESCAGYVATRTHEPSRDTAAPSDTRPDGDNRGRMA